MKDDWHSCLDSKVGFKVSCVHSAVLVTFSVIEVIYWYAVYRDFNLRPNQFFNFNMC